MAASWNLPPIRPGQPATPELEERRARAAGTRSGDEPVTENDVGGVRCLIINEGGAGPTFLYFHGGGYRLGSPVTYIALARRIADLCDARIVMPFYRLAPEHPFPAGLHDAVAVYEALARDHEVVVGGDSAGGGLAAALCVAAHRAGAMPAGTILLSPMLDLLASDPTYESNAEKDLFFSRQAVADCAALYLQDADPRDPLVSPIFAEPEQFPSMLILAGGHEVLLGEAIRFSTRLALADRRVTLHAAPAMGHVWPVLAPQDAASAEAVAAIADFLRSRTCLRSRT